MSENDNPMVQPTRPTPRPSFTVPQAIAYANGISDLYGSHFKDCLLTLVKAAEQSLAPSLPPEAVAVLEAAMGWSPAWDDKWDDSRRLVKALQRWQVAGRPGLPPHAGAKGGE
jgi:hypothetical protein